MSRNRQKARAFINKPKKGDKIKVLYKNKKAEFGVVINITENTGREVAVLERVEEEILLSDCNYCLDSHKVRFRDEKNKRDSKKEVKRVRNR